MQSFKLLLCCLAIVAFSMPMSAQTTAPPEPTIYHTFAYIKVKPGMYSDYLKMEKAYKKLHLAKKAEGTLDDWSLMEVISPSGSSNEYDFVARNQLRGEAQLAQYYEGEYMPKNWMSLLTPEEVGLVMRTEEIRTIVKSEVWSGVDRVLGADWYNGKVLAINYFTSPEGKTRDDHFKMEKEIWKPVHEARVKNGTMEGWSMMSMEFPFGASMPYNSLTVDIYKNMTQYLKPWSDEDFKKVHPGKDVDKLMAETQAATTLTKGEVRMVVDRLNWK